MTSPAVPALRVVVADNDPAALELVVTDLQLSGFEVVGSAMQGDAAIELCRDLVPDVLVTDYRMPPGPNGIEVALAVRGLGDPPHVVVYTNYRDEKMRREARRGGVEVLPKGNIRALRTWVASVSLP